jgi:hypothetical protein
VKRVRTMRAKTANVKGEEMKLSRWPMSVYVYRTIDAMADQDFTVSCETRRCVVSTCYLQDGPPRKLYLIFVDFDREYIRECG